MLEQVLSVSSWHRSPQRMTDAMWIDERFLLDFCKQKHQGPHAYAGMLCRNFMQGAQQSPGALWLDVDRSLLWAIRICHSVQHAIAWYSRRPCRVLMVHSIDLSISSNRALGHAAARSHLTQTPNAISETGIRQSLEWLFSVCPRVCNNKNSCLLASKWFSGP